ncbi:MAG: hypothetical protein JWR17_4767 [Pseudomonas sp.]|uniref:hypothetical protein n=1 Tax=Pseudomonas sp. TaxID=306 RepID=UPI0026226675|nr:hypothetical protein [Pseudomonas sp.]MDB6052021.1 hypothetical protein [Pseudomonas sp.]
MQVRGKVFNDWMAAAAPEETYSQSLENGCCIDVRAREVPSGDIQLLVCVYAKDGTACYEHVSALDGNQWTVQDALSKGEDQAERIAGGEGGRLPCADAGRLGAG